MRSTGGRPSLSSQDPGGAIRLPRRVWRIQDMARRESSTPCPRMAERDDTQSKSRIQLPILPLMANATRLTVVRDQAKPRKLGRYELEECIGVEGGIETYRARVRGLAGFDRIFAVKCLRRGRGGPI